MSALLKVYGVLHLLATPLLTPLDIFQGDWPTVTIVYIMGWVLVRITLGLHSVKAGDPPGQRPPG